MKTDFDKLRGDFSIYTNGIHVVLAGAKLYVFRPDGTMVACRPDLRHGGRIAFLSGNRLLLCSRSVFHLIDLETGADIAAAPFPKMDFNRSVALSPDERYAYAADTRRGTGIISRLDLQTMAVEPHELYPDAGATRDLICDEAGVPCLLKTLNATIGGVLHHDGGVRLHDFDGVAPGDCTQWMTRWLRRDDWNASRFLGSPHRILTTDLRCFHPADGTVEDLLCGDDRSALPRQRILGSRITPEGRYLCLMMQTVTLILDLAERRIAARYAADGCLVGNEFWACAEGRILRRPFPDFDPVPPVKTHFGGTMDCSKHPELW